MQPIGLYLHIPFCQHRCSYCDFNTYTSLGDLKMPYAKALAAEIRQVGKGAEAQFGQRVSVSTLFLGGGTPSLMPVAGMAEILTAVSEAFDLAPNAEMSMEANPGTVDETYLIVMRELGLNRLSFGVQSVIPSELQLLEREHDFGTVVGAVSAARSAGFDNFNLDLIYGVPGQTLASWEESVRTLLALQPTHMSLYCLTIEPGTPMQRWLKNGRISPPDPDLAADQYELAGRLMGEQGFVHYEISNWAQPGLECQHNLIYWRDETYFGLGAGAHGHMGRLRYHVVKQPRVYIRRMHEAAEKRPFPLTAALAGQEQLNEQMAMGDRVMTQLRLLNEGLDLAGFASTFGKSLTEAYPGTVEQLEEWEMVKRENGRLLLTEKGRFLSNQVFYRFI